MAKPEVTTLEVTKEEFRGGKEGASWERRRGSGGCGGTQTLQAYCVYERWLE